MRAVGRVHSRARNAGYGLEAGPAGSWRSPSSKRRRVFDRSAPPRDRGRSSPVTARGAHRAGMVISSTVVRDAAVGRGVAAWTDPRGRFGRQPLCRGRVALRRATCGVSDGALRAGGDAVPSTWVPSTRVGSCCRPSACIDMTALCENQSLRGWHVHGPLVRAADRPYVGVGGRSA